MAEYFLKLLSLDSGGGIPHFPILAEETIIKLRQYDWPGNVRELRNVLQQALLVARDGVILPSHLPPLAMPLPGDDALARRIAAALDNAPEFAADTVMNPIEKELSTDDGAAWRQSVAGRRTSGIAPGDPSHQVEAAWSGGRGGKIGFHPSIYSFGNWWGFRGVPEFGVIKSRRCWTSYGRYEYIKLILACLWPGD